MSRSHSPVTQRLRYFEGQPLAAADMQDDADFEQRLRGLHVRGMHNTWGVALGFEVSRTSDQAIHVGPGIAYDSAGGEIVSAQDPDIGPPVSPLGTKATAWWFDLVVSHVDRPSRLDNGPGCEDVASTASWRWCYAGEAPEGAPSPASVAPDVRLGEEIPLVRCRVTDQRTFDDLLDFSVRRKAQGLVRPHIYGRRETVSLSINVARLVFSATIQTAPGGFNGTPFYFARVVIPSLLDAANVPSELRFVGPFVSIRDPSRTSFAVDLRIGVSRAGPVIFFGGSTGLSAMSAAENRGLDAIVDWVGIEPNGGCPPPPRLNLGFFLYRPALASQFLREWMHPGSLIANEGSRHG